MAHDCFLKVGLCLPSLYFNCLCEKFVVVLESLKFPYVLYVDDIISINDIVRVKTQVVHAGISKKIDFKIYARWQVIGKWYVSIDLYIGE